jgi:endonuclease YncB( thermonuclease family)
MTHSTAIAALTFVILVAPMTYGYARQPIIEAVSDREGYQIQRNVEVSRILDGDTIDIIGKHGKILRIRILDLDTPELRAKCDMEREWGQMAKDRLSSLLLHRDVSIAFKLRTRGRHEGKLRKGKWGRYLGDVYSDGRLVSAVLIGEGLGRPYSGLSRRDGWCGDIINFRAARRLYAIGEK